LLDAAKAKVKERKRLDVAVGRMRSSRI